MRNKKIGFFLSFVSILVLGCGFLGSFGQSNPLSANNNASAPFPDVPLFPGSTADDKVNMIAQMMDPAMIVRFYYTDKSPDEVMAFYTNDLMKEQNWDPQPYDIVKHFSTEGWGPQVPEGTTAGGCEMIPDKQPPQGFCTFVKTDDKGQHVELLIDAGPDDKSDRIRLIYSRMTDVKK